MRTSKDAISLTESEQPFEYPPEQQPSSIPFHTPSGRLRKHHVPP